MAGQKEKKLNKQQLEAIKHGQGPLLIIAGAGTGKTTVITERIKYLISSELAKPAEILALTFTDKAAREMEERVDLAMPYGYTDMWISTFHSFCDRVLRQEALQIGLDPGYHLMAQAETTQFLITNLFKFELDYFRPRGNPTKFIGGLLQHFSRLKDEDVESQEYLRYTRRETKKAKSKEEKTEANKTMELAKAYRAYEELKVKEGVADFDDLISNVVKLFRNRRNILGQYQKQFKYILVDEFQDTNIVQNELVILLAGKKANLTVVADDDQCLPADAKIATPNGKKEIKNIKVGDEVVTAVGKGYVSISQVNFVNKVKKKARFLTFITDRRTKITVTDNHKMFCFVPPRVYKNRNLYYVYLMHRQNLGWRLGVTNDLAQRLRLERSADRITGIKTCNTEQEARYFETFCSLKYHLPTVAFKPRKGMAITGKWLKKLYKEINTEKNVQKLAKDLSIDLQVHHCCLNGVVRGNSRRVKINLRLCKRRNRTKWARNRYLLNPKVLHEVSLETSDKETIKKLHNAGVKLLGRRKGKGLKKLFSELTKAGQFARKLVEITDGILEVKFDVAKRGDYARQSLVMPAGNILVGHFLPILRNYQIVYEKIIDIKEKEKKETVYDLEIDRTHNFIADGAVIHNSIYKWRGAAISNVIQFKNCFPKAKIVTLIQNYRSTQEILDNAYKLIQHNNPDRLEVKEKIVKKLKAVRQIKGKPIELLHADRVENEAEMVAKTAAKLTRETGLYDYKDVAILVRANNHAEPFARALSRAGLPYQFLGPGQLFRQPEVKDLIGYLNVLDNFEDNVSLYRVLSMEHFDISARDLAGINNFARKTNLSFFEACEKVDKIFVAQKTKEKITDFVKMVHRHLKLLTKETAGQILYYFLQDSGLLKKLTEYKTITEEKHSQNIAKFFDRLKTYEVNHEDATVSAVVNWLKLSMEMGESPLASNVDWVEENRVNLLTVHSSKGLEFPVVFLVNLVSARFPTRQRQEQIPIPEALIKEILPAGDYHQQEERRLFYVGMTRARNRLFLTAADYYGEAKREKKISPFVAETLGQGKIKPAVSRAIKQLGLLDWAPVKKLEKEPVRQPINYLSYSQIDTFNTCPLQYRYRYIQRIPVPPSAPLSFGSSIHKTLRDFYQQVKDGKKPTEKDLLGLLSGNWVVEGYANKVHERRRKKQGKQMLKDFYQKGYDSKNIPLSLEQVFVIKISPSLKVGGKIDRVDRVKKGLEIIDYKTGKVWDQKEVDKSLQMTVYALAATGRGIYAKKPEEVVLSFYFLGSGEKKTTRRTPNQLKEARQELQEKAKEINQSDFQPKPSKLCDFCDYKLICEAWS
ncbi:MAG TPA: UvrD-helicase domain-containing protein [Nevskiaceae bacterium]|nr:UvrD-helicase domain-containing protein [Nevskiaceae bacterium]